MIIGIKDILKLFAITIVILCATFVCTIFLNYNIDIRTVKDQVTTEQAIIVYNAKYLQEKLPQSYLVVF